MQEESFAFRLRYTRSPRKTLNCYERELRLPTSEPSQEVKLKARDADKAIEASRSLVLHGSGWASAEETQYIGRFYADILARVCARLGLGADFGERTTARSWFTKHGLELLSRQRGGAVLNDVHGLMVYEQATHPNVAFSELKGDVIVGVSLEQFLSVYNAALARPRDLSDEERAALLLFNASFFPDSADARFMLLMMAAEALFLKQRPLSDAVVAIVKEFSSTVDTAILKPEEKQDLKSRLGNIGFESIRQAGVRTVTEKLSAKKYNGMSAGEFFDLCYTLRSRLAHGNMPLPTLEEVNGVVAQLETMVSELLSTDLLDVGPQR